MELEKINENENLTFESLSTSDLIESYEEISSFLKIVDDEIKKTDVGDSDE